MRQEEDPEETNGAWSGGNATRRLGVWYDDQASLWTISGRHENDAGAGDAHDMVQLARIILENIPDECGETLDLNEVADRLPHYAGAVLDLVAEAATTNAGVMDAEQQAHMGNGLISAGLHLVRLARQAALRDPWETGETHPELLEEPVGIPFRTQVAERIGYEQRTDRRKPC